ncbi:MAG: hypothetical protein BWY61_01884 [Firmicutes bacterium ADurb.Bin354]|nr:MAG: hypothetical protein BWY61_01884 [Firmicutes bacterium ADurb.Bin354]
MARTITKDMLIPEILEMDPYIANMLMAQGMHCISCYAAAGESLAEAMFVHGYSADDIDVMVNELNDYLKQKEEYEAENDAEARKAAGVEPADASSENV